MLRCYTSFIHNMGIRPTFIFTDKILPHNIDKTKLLRNVKSINVSYKHSDNEFNINLLKTPSPEDTEQQNLDTNHSNITEHSFNVERNTFISTVLQNIICHKNEHESKPKKIVIDFSSPNIAKPFHVGHLRSTIIGNFIGNINSYFDNKVIRINYLGDWGTQFGLLQYGLQAKNINVNDLKSNPMKTLYDAYVYANKLSSADENVHEEARRYFSDIEQGRKSLDNWKIIREITIQELEKVYKRLGITFDAYHWESDYNGGAIKQLINSMEEIEIIKTDDSGKKIVTINNRDVTVLKSDNSTLYLSRDIAALLDRYRKYKFDKMLYVVDNAQTDHFTAVFEIVKQLNNKCTDGCEHIKFGRIRGMSTRSGNAVFLNDILDEAKQKMHDKQMRSKNTRTVALIDETSDILGTTAVIINDLKQRRLKDYVFDWNKVLQTEGDTGIKLQYLHCRLWSLEQNCGISVPDYCDPQYLSEEIIGDVVAELAKFEHVLQRSLEEYEACILVSYLFRLARHVNRMFNQLKVKNVDTNLAMQRLLVFHSARVVVKTGLEILGVKSLHKM